MTFIIFIIFSTVPTGRWTQLQSSRNRRREKNIYKKIALFISRSETTEIINRLEIISFHFNLKYLFAYYINIRVKYEWEKKRERERNKWIEWAIFSSSSPPFDWEFEMMIFSYLITFDCSSILFYIFFARSLIFYFYLFSICCIYKYINNKNHIKHLIFWYIRYKYISTLQYNILIKSSKPKQCATANSPK